MMIYTKMFNIVKYFLNYIVNCRIFIGAHPDAVDTPAIVFFPLLATQLNCGFAGLMSCRLRGKPSDIPTDRTLADLWNKVKIAGLQTVLAGENTTANYLNSVKTLQAMDMAIAELKQEDTQEFLFFQEDRAADLSRVAGEMKKFLIDEEKRLEDQAAIINSVDVEMINSRLLSLKDIYWILE